MIGVMTFMGTAQSFGTEELTTSVAIGGAITAALATAAIGLKRLSLKETMNEAAKNVKHAVDDWNKVSNEVMRYLRQIEANKSEIKEDSKWVHKARYINELIEKCMIALKKERADWVNHKEHGRDEFFKARLAAEAKALNEDRARFKAECAQHQAEHSAWEKQVDSYKYKVEKEASEKLKEYKDRLDQREHQLEANERALKQKVASVQKKLEDVQSLCSPDIKL
jgi:chromosome segregation ATPase